jgi:hypothetical protein
MNQTTTLRIPTPVPVPKMREASRPPPQVRKTRATRSQNEFPGEEWTESEMDNFRKMYPHLKNLEDSILKRASLRDITSMGKQKVSNGKFLNQTMTSTYEHLCNFPEQIPAGPDDCTGLGDLLTPKVWAKIHKPNARDLSIMMLSQGSVTNAWKDSDKTDAPKEFETLFDFKMAMLTLEGAIHKVMPWNFAFKTVYIFVVSVDFGESDLSENSARVQFLTNFVDEALRANARNWEEKKKFLSNQDLCVKWNSHLTRKGALLKPTKGSGGKQDQSKTGRGIQREEKGAVLGLQSLQ